MRKVIVTAHYLILCLTLLFVGMPGSTKSEPLENDVGKLLVKKSVEKMDKITQENLTSTPIKSYKVNAIVDFVVPVIQDNKIGFNEKSSCLATVSLPLNQCSCRGSPIFNIRKDQ